MRDFIKIEELELKEKTWHLGDREKRDIQKQKETLKHNLSTPEGLTLSRAMDETLLRELDNLKAEINDKWNHNIKCYETVKELNKKEANIINQRHFEEYNLEITISKDRIRFHKDKKEITTIYINRDWDTEEVEEIDLNFYTTKTLSTNTFELDRLQFIGYVAGLLKKDSFCDTLKNACNTERDYLNSNLKEYSNLEKRKQYIISQIESEQAEACNVLAFQEDTWIPVIKETVLNLRVIKRNPKTLQVIMTDDYKNQREVRVSKDSWEYIVKKVVNGEFVLS